MTSSARSFSAQLAVGLFMFCLLSYLMWSLAKAGPSDAPPPQQPLQSFLVEDDTTIHWPAPPHTFPALMVKKEPGDTVSEPLRISSLKIDVKVIGNIATTTLEMSFYNDLDRILEGEFYFPLGEGQTVSRFAMDVNGKFREAVVVEKAKGREVFESIVRRGIDPGLLELTKGNNFKSRVYPIPAKGYKHILVAYEHELINSGQAMIYQLPLMFKKKVDDFAVRVEVLKQKIEPVLHNNEITNFKFDKWNDSYVASAQYKNYLPGSQLAFALPHTGNELGVYVEEHDRESYFYTNIIPQRFTRPKKLPSVIGLLWDVSGSASSRDLDRELSILDAYFVKVSNATIKLVAFSNDVWSVEEYKLVQGNWASLKGKLKSFKYDGGTQLGSLDLKKYPCEEFILSTDGISNFGKSEVILASAPVIVMNSSPSADHSYMKYLAMASGGQYIDVARVTTEEALQQLASQPYRFISATYDKAQIAETYPSVSTGFTRSFALSGKLLTDKAEVTLNFGFGNKIEYSQKVVISRSDLTGSGLVKRIWAQKKLGELDMLFEKNKDEITELGKKHAIVTRSTSLIVLDRVEDYVQHRIAPPSELKAEYDQMIAKEEEDKRNVEKEHMERVVEMFTSRIDWWNKDFKHDPPVKEKDKKTTGQHSEGETIEVQVSSPQGVTADSVVTISNGATMNATGTASYTWSAGNSNQEGAVLGFSSGAYNVTVTDANGYTVKDLESEEYKEKESSISLKAWNPDEPYMKKLKAVPVKDAYAAYLDLKKEYGTTPSFFLDVADYFRDKKDLSSALRVLSNIAEMELENHQLLRVLAHRLEQLRHYDLAVLTFKEVLKIREEEPQSYRDLGLAYAANGQEQEAIDMLYEVVKGSWDTRFPEIELIAAGEMNAVIARAKTKVNTSRIDKRLLKNMPVDVRVVIDWDSDNCDMDLWVTDPFGEKCLYSQPDTYTGGHMSKDFTGGYGPEEFIIKKAVPGKYTVQINYYGDRQQRIAGATTVQARLITNYGRPSQKEQNITLRLKDVKDVIDIGEMAFLP
jgi:hypothetical protein